MIINLRGTSGSGKSTIVRNLMARYEVTPHHRASRKQPIGYRCLRSNGNNGRALWVVGHYETPCGGADTVPTVDEVYSWVTNAAEKGYDVIYEGLIIQSDVRRCIEIAKQHPTFVAIVDPPLDLCLAGIQARRDARGDTRPLDPTNTISKKNSVSYQLRRLREGGVNVQLFQDRDEAMKACLEALGWS